MKAKGKKEEFCEDTYCINGPEKRMVSERRLDNYEEVVCKH